jgi:heme/copper-type cytochrome/quinol oxidase subunit 2
MAVDRGCTFMPGGCRHRQGNRPVAVAYRPAAREHAIVEVVGVVQQALILTGLVVAQVEIGEPADGVTPGAEQTGCDDGRD